VENFGIMSPGRSRSNSGSGSSSFGAIPPRYPGDDTRPTSPKELAGWYAYAFAAEVYVICGIGMLLTALLTVSGARKLTANN
jgi:UMF1 family MFS transporter